MLIPVWRQAPDDLRVGEDTFYVRSTVVYRGPIITPNGMKPGTPEFSPRRYSVITYVDGEVVFYIGSVAYITSFDSADPHAVHRKFDSGEWSTLMQLETDLTLEQALHWTGEQWTDSINYSE